MQSDKLALLASSPLFSSLDAKQLEELAAIAVPKAYAAGENLFLEGDPCEGLFVIAQGTVRLIKTVPSGRQIMLATETAPNSIAEVPVFDGGPYPASVVAAGDVQILLLPRRQLLAFCVRNPEVALQMLAVFGRRLRHLVGLLEGVTFGSVRQRLAQMILETEAQSREDSFLLPGTHEELAQRLGTVREVVSRNIGRFQAEGLFRVERKRVTMLDRAGLEREAETAI